MKNGELLKLYETLVELTNDKTQKFNIKVSYTLAKNKDKIRSEAILLYDARRQLLLEYGTIDENGDILIPKDQFDKVNHKIDDLLSLESTLELDIIPLNWLDGYDLSLEQVDALMPILYKPIETGPPIIN